MEDAKIKGVDQNITAEDLWYIENVKSYHYQCISCEIGLSPRSFDRDVNVRRPYFRKQTEHEDYCFYLSEAYLNRKNRKRVALRNEDGKPGHYPSEFVLPSLIPISDSPLQNSHSLNQPDSENTASKDRDRGLKSQPSRERPYKTSSFRLLVNHYLHYPGDRNLPLTAESIDGYNYWTCFKSLFTDSDNPLKKPKNKIYFANSKWDKPIVNSNSITIQFDAYFLDDNENKHNLFLVINTESWNDTVKEAFLHDFNKARRDIIESEGSKKLKIFFLGEQSGDNPLEFSVSTPLLISFNIA